jgi:benzoyl-CoA reductase/2-hydroxyglutaryl-CoA dehydratase subunit BcrC/BadD/HgdB
MAEKGLIMEEQMLKPIFADGRPTRDRLKIGALKRLMHSRLGLRLARAALTRGVTYKPHDQASADFFLELAQQAYADHTPPVVWTNIFVPCELLWGLGLVPFYPETWAGLGASLGLSRLGVEGAEAQGYPVDLCTVHRSAAGLRAAGLYPRVDAYVATSNTCDVTSQMLASTAHAQGRPFFFLDVPQGEDETAVAYLTAQLQQLVEGLTKELGVPFDPERMRQSIRLSNRARTLVLEVAELREANPAPLRGSALLDQLGVLTSMFGHPAGVTYYRALRDYTLERIRCGEPEQANQRVRLYWMHLKPYFPTEFLPHMEDDLGAVIAFEETSSVWWDRLDEEQPLRSLARKILGNYYNGPVERRVDMALRHISRYRCVAAVHFSHWGCRQSSGALHVLRGRLRRHGVPLLVLDGDCVDPTNLPMGPLRTRVEAFVEMLV